MKAILMIIMMIIMASDVQAQQQACGPRDRLVARLSAEYGEVPTSSGVTGNGELIEVLTSSSGSWTIISTRPGGVACFLATGDGWIERAPTVPGRDA